MRTILVTGATGHQGSATVKSLLAIDTALTSSPSFKVVALTRNPSSAASKALQSLDSTRVQLVQCDLDDEKATRAVFDDYKQRNDTIYGVFCVLAFPGLGKSALGELKQGKLLVDCAIEHGVKHFVYSSVDRGGNGNDDEYTLDRATKVAIERYLKEKADATGSVGDDARMAWTILLPGFFMQNFLGTIGKATAGVLREGLKSDTKVSLVASEDIGAVARVVFENREKYSSLAFTVASEALTSTERDAAFRRAVPGTPPHQGLPSIPAFLARLLIRWNDLTRLLCEDIERVHKVYDTNDDGTPERHLQTVRDALGGIAPPDGENEAGMTSFETFCARNYPAGRLYQGNGNKGDEDKKKSWNGVSRFGLIKDSMARNEKAL